MAIWSWHQPSAADIVSWSNDTNTDVGKYHPVKFVKKEGKDKIYMKQ
jgi:hypothetical protein